MRKSTQSIFGMMALVLTLGLSHAEAFPGHNRPGRPGRPGVPPGHGGGHNPGHPGNPGYPGYPGNPGHGGGHNPGHPGNPGYPSYPGHPGNPGHGSHLSQNAPQIVRAMYRGMLFREPDAGGFNNAVRAIQQQGMQGLTNVAMGIGNSPEFRQNIATRYRSRQIVKNLYRELLGREGEPQGVQGWAAQLDQGRGGDVLSGFVNSEEFRNRYVY